MPSQTRSASVFGERVLRALFIWFPFIIILSVYPKLWKCQPLAWPYCRFFFENISFTFGRVAPLIPMVRLRKLAG
jgi:hypothetical protein